MFKSGFWYCQKYINENYVLVFSLQMGLWLNSVFKILVQGDVIGMTHGAYLICCNAIAAFCNLILKLCE